MGRSAAITQLIHFRYSVRMILQSVVVAGMIWCSAVPAAGEPPIELGVSLPVQRMLLAALQGVQPESWPEMALTGSPVSRLDIWLMHDDGVDPHTWEPAPSQLAALSRSVGYISAGLRSEQRWRSRATEANPSLEWLPPPEGSHYPDQHFWLSPPMLLAMISQYEQRLSTLEPANAGSYQHNAARLKEQVQALHLRLQRRFDNLPNKTFLVQHGAWDLFADTYGLEQLVIEHEDKSVTPGRLRSLIGQADALGIDVVFTDPGHRPRSARMLADALQAELVMLHPYGERWYGDIEHAAHLIAEALK